MIVRYGILTIVFLIFNRISPTDSSSSRSISNYLHMVCQFLKLPDICRNGYKSNFLKFDFAFGLNLAEECDYQNDTVSDVYFLGDTKQIFLYSVFDFRLEPVKHLETVDSQNGERLYSTLIPLSDTISMFNNKNVPNIFVFLPITPGFRTENLTLTVKFDGFEKHDLNEHQTAKVALGDRHELLEDCTPRSDELFVDRLNKTVPRSGIHRPSSKRISLKDGNFHAHLQMPISIRKTLMSDAFIEDQNSLNRSLFLSMHFAFDGDIGSADQQTAFSQNISALRGTIALIHCSKIKSSNFITYSCETITDYDKGLECFCDYFKPAAAYFRYDRFVLIVTAAIVGVFLVRTTKVLLDYLRKVLLFKRTMQDRTLYMLCSSRTAMYGYIIKFEIGCASASFDFETTCIDFELQGPDGQRMTLGRIPSKMLFKERINQIEFKLKRLTQLNRGMLDSVLIKHNCSNPNAKIFLYDLILSQIGDPKTVFRFSVNDYVRSYRQRYVLTVNTFANLGSFEKDSSRDSRIRQVESIIAPNQIKSCELFPSKRIHLQNFPNLNDFEVNLSLFFSLLCSFLVNIWLIEHKLCIKRNFLCYFNHFKISFILTSSVYLLIFIIYRLLKHRQMKCIYLKQPSIWRYGVDFLHLLVLVGSLGVFARIYTSNITLYIADFYALLFSIMFTFPLFILLLDLINVFIESITFRRSLTFKSFRSTKSSDRLKPEKTVRSGVMDSFINYKSAEFKPSVDYSTETNEESEYSSAKLPNSAELDDYYLELKNLKSSRKLNGSDNSIKSVKSFSINPTDHLPAKSD